MAPLFSLRGYTADDPLDTAPGKIRYVLTACCAAAIALAFLYLVFDILHIATPKYSWLPWLECAAIVWPIGVPAIASFPRRRPYSTAARSSKGNDSYGAKNNSGFVRAAKTLLEREAP